MQDPYAYGLHGREHFGVPYDPEKEVRCRFLNENVSGWENETAPAVEYENVQASCPWLYEACQKDGFP